MIPVAAVPAESVRVGKDWGETMAQGAQSGELLLIATPIGNLADLTRRAADALAGLDLLLCEDTRITARLIGHLGLRVPLRAYHDHNADRQRPAVLAALAAGQRVGLVSDAGTPLVSDPGFKLVRACLDAGVAVTALPGPSAPTTALLLSGLPPDRFYFGGFLPPRAGPRQRALAAVAALDATLIFFESARRLAASLADAGAVLGPRPAAVARELTKRFEEVRRADLATLAAHYATAGPPKGEIVVVIGGADAAAGVASAEEVDAKLTLKLADASLRDAVRQVTAESGWTRANVYVRALALRDGDG